MFETDSKTGLLLRTVLPTVLQEILSTKNIKRKQREELKNARDKFRNTEKKMLKFKLKCLMLIERRKTLDR